MIIITATVLVEADHYSEAVAFAQRHVAASRLEEGCLSHQYFEDPEHERRLVFLEMWKDQAAIDHHFAQPYSREFVEVFRSWCERDLALDIHHVSKSDHVDLAS